MSVIVVGKMVVAPENVEKLWAERGDEFEAIAAAAKQASALSHRWGFGADEVVIIDEWPDAASFQAFFGSNAAIADLMGAAGVQGPPEFIITEARTSPDEF